MSAGLSGCFDGEAHVLPDCGVGSQSHETNAAIILHYGTALTYRAGEEKRLDAFYYDIDAIPMDTGILKIVLYSALTDTPVILASSAFRNPDFNVCERLLPHLDDLFGLLDFYAPVERKYLRSLITTQARDPRDQVFVKVVDIEGLGRNNAILDMIQDRRVLCFDGRDNHRTMIADQFFGFHNIRLYDFNLCSTDTRLAIHRLTEKRRRFISVLKDPRVLASMSQNTALRHELI